MFRSLSSGPRVTPGYSGHHKRPARNRGPPPHYVARELRASSPAVRHVDAASTSRCVSSSRQVGGNIWLFYLATGGSGVFGVTSKAVMGSDEPSKAQHGGSLYVSLGLLQECPGVIQERRSFPGSSPQLLTTRETEESAGKLTDTSKEQEKDRYKKGIARQVEMEEKDVDREQENVERERKETLLRGEQKVEKEETSDAWNNGDSPRKGPRAPNHRKFSSHISGGI
ncbi:hypothetical protein NDU88_003168 [Pleurodeles waltl]|uniref:Uncharacterized protein n=1 Tax=Pleurodeles waltl TaxID=8319 RepID=A0AAV7LM72_PLEWA|nr:hypothetical protein NDU88_003168 [Pleurodeles waltl]